MKRDFMCTSLVGLWHACWQIKVTINQEKCNGGYRIVSLVPELDCIDAGEYSCRYIGVDRMQNMGNSLFKAYASMEVRS